MSFPSILFLTVINLLNYLDRYLAAGILPLIMLDLNLTNSQGGSLGSSFVFGYLIFSPLFGYLGDRYNRVKLMALGVFVWSAATMLSGLASPFLCFIAARVLVGIGEASFGSITPGYLKDRISDPRKLHFALSIFFSAIPIGSALGFWLGGFIAARLNWHYAFLICGAPGIILSICLLFFKEAPRPVPAPVNFFRSFGAVLAVPSLIFAFVGYALNSFALNGIAFFVTKYGAQIGFENEEITKYFGIILVITGALGTLAGGKLSSIFAERSNNQVASMLRFIGVLSLIGTPFTVVAFFSRDQTVFLLCCFVAELLIFSTVTAVNAVIVRAAPPGLVTFTQGASILVLNLFGSLPAPKVVGMVADSMNLGIGLQLASLTLLFSGLVWLVGGRMLRDHAATAKL